MFGIGLWMLLYSYCEPKVLVSTIFLLSKTELGLIADSRYNIFLTDIDSHPLDVWFIGRILTSNYMSTYGKMFARREAVEASKIATALGFTYNIGTGKEYIEGTWQIWEDESLNLADELTDLRVKALVNIKRNLVVTCNCINTSNRSQYFKLLDKI